MKIDPVLNKAARLAKMRDYEGAIRILEFEENRYAGSYSYYYLFAVICLYSGDFGGALTKFKLAREIKIREPKTILGFAALLLRRKNTSQAVNYYLEVEELDPGNKTAKKALAIIRKYSDPDALTAWLESGKLEKLYPPIPSPSVTSKFFIILSAILAAAFILTFFILINARVINNPFSGRTPRHAVEFNLTGAERTQPVVTGGSYRYILTRDQALDLYDKALSLFTSYRDEKAKININQIIESNASEGIKNRARILLDNLEVPGFDTFKQADNISCTEARIEPVLYRDVHVIWKGMATNVNVLDEYTSFDFLVGYDTRKTLEAIVPVVFFMPVSINTERPLEVLGKIVLQGANQEIIMLEGVAIHQSGRLEN